MVTTVKRASATRRRTFIGVAILATLGLAAPAFAGGELETELAAVAAQLSKFLKRSEKTTVSVGQFTCPPQFNANAGPGISKILVEELKGDGIDVKKLADLGIKGEYRLILKSGETGPYAQIKGSIEDLNGKHLFSFNRNVRGEATLANLFGLTVSLPPSESEPERGKLLVASVMTPQTFVKTSRVSAGEKSPYAIEILVKETSGDDYKPRVPTDDDRLAFVKIKRGEIYAVRLINDSDTDAAVTLTIDGLNLFAFSQNHEFSHVIVPRKSQGIIPGWHISNDRSDSFKVVAYAQSEVARLLPDSPSEGIVTATFAAAWPRDDKPPGDESRSQLAKRGRDATGRGPAVEAKYRTVERTVGVVRSSVSVRYTKVD